MQNFFKFSKQKPAAYFSLKLFFFLLLCISSIRAQTSYKVKNYTTNQGLSNSSVNDIFKDSSGFIWIATEQGLNKFDGNSFTVYTSANHQLPENSILNTLEVDKDIFFCISATSGYFFFDARNESVTLTKVSNTSFNYKNYKLRKDKHYVYVQPLNSNFILKFDVITKSVSDTIEQKGIRLIDFDVSDQGEVILLTEAGLKSYNNHKFFDYYLKGLGSFNVSETNSFHYRKNKYYFSKNGILYIYDALKNQLSDSVVYSSENIPINKLITGREDEIWFSTQLPAGVFKYELNTRQLLDFSAQFNADNNSVSSIEMDSEENVWVGTYNFGLYKISPSVFRTKEYYRGNNIYYLKFIDNFNLFAATVNGLVQINTSDGSSKKISPDTSIDSHIYGVLFTAKNILVLNEKFSKTIVTDDKKKYQFLKFRKLCMLNDSVGIAGAWSDHVDLVYINYDTSVVIRSKLLEGSDGNRNRVNCFLKDKSGMIWCGTDMGLYLMSQDLSVCKKFKYKIFNAAIYDIVETDYGIYLATSRGLVEYANKKLNLIKELNNQPIDKITGLCVGAKGDLYIGTLNGFFRIRRESGSTYFDEDDGLISKEITDLDYNDVTNLLLISTNRGISEFNLYQYKYLNKNIPKLRLIRVTSTGRLEYENGVYEVQENNINVYFGSIGFRHAGSISYKWILDGSETHYSKNPSIELAAMNYGTHRIDMFVSNNGKNWSPPISVTVHVLMPFYKNIWFISVLSVLLLVLFSYLLVMRVRRKDKAEKLRTEMEQKLSSLKFEALNASINPHFIFNALNSVQHYINMGRNDEASDYLAKFGYMIRQTLENATEHFITIHDEVERIEMYMELEQDRFNHGFEFDIHIDERINAHQIKIPNMILQPLIENSILHGFKNIDYKGKIELKFIRKDANLFISIEDNGNGLGKNMETPVVINIKHKRKSIAVENIKERIKNTRGASMNVINKADIYKNQTGVIVEFLIPIEFQA